VRGAITLVVQVIGATTERLCALRASDGIADVVGPLGRPTELAHFGHVVLVGGGVGTAVIYPQASALEALAIGSRRDRRPLAAVRDPGGGAPGRLRCGVPVHGRRQLRLPGFVTGKLGELIDDPTIPFRS